MRKTLALWVLVSIVLFAVAWTVFLDVSAIPVGMLAGLILAGFRYAVDRWGIGEIDTIYIFQYEDPDHKHYFGALRDYSMLFALGFVLAFWGLSGVR